MADGAPQLGAVPFNEAIDFFRRKFRLPTEAWTDIWQGMHARAFVVAGAQSDALLKDFQDALLKAMQDGRTLEDFRADFDRIVATHGWSYKGARGWRSRVIFNTNMRTAAAAGRWAQIQRLKEVRPYIRYMAVMDSRTRPMHRTWHGTVLPVDHPFWDTHSPPNGFNCRCTVQSLSARDLKRYGYTVSTEPPLSPLVTRAVNTPAGVATVRVPAGIEPGFAYNPGRFDTGGPPPAGIGGGWPGQLWGETGPSAPVPFTSYAARDGDGLVAVGRRLYTEGMIDAGFREDEDALRAYSGEGYTPINNRLRGETDEDDDDDFNVSDTIDEIDAAIRNFRMPEGVVLHRGLRGPHARYLRSLPPGTEIDEPGFLSSSLTDRAAAKFGDGLSENSVLVTILWPKGQPFYPMDGQGYGLGSEHEIVLPRGAKLRIVEVRDGRLVMEVVIE